MTAKCHGLAPLGVGTATAILPITPVDDMAISCRTHCICPPGTERKCTQRRQVPGSNAFVPSVVGLIIAGEVIKDLTGFKGRGIGA